jgi:hypothetical protein
MEVRAGGAAGAGGAVSAALAANWGIHSGLKVPEADSCAHIMQNVPHPRPKKCSGCLFITRRPSIRGNALLSYFNNSGHHFPPYTSSVTYLYPHSEPALINTSFLLSSRDLFS